MTDVALLDAPAEDWEPEDTFGARLALIRQRFHWNVSEAAKATGTAAATWTKWEEGASPRDYLATCEKIAASVGCSMKWLVQGTKNWKKLSASDLQVLPGGGVPELTGRKARRGEQLTFRAIYAVPDLV